MSLVQDHLKNVILGVDSARPLGVHGLRFKLWVLGVSEELPDVFQVIEGGEVSAVHSDQDGFVCWLGLPDVSGCTRGRTACIRLIAFCKTGQQKTEFFLPI